MKRTSWTRKIPTMAPSKEGYKADSAIVAYPRYRRIFTRGRPAGVEYDAPNRESGAHCIIKALAQGANNTIIEPKCWTPCLPPLLSSCRPREDPTKGHQCARYMTIAEFVMHITVSHAEATTNYRCQLPRDMCPTINDFTNY